MLNRPFRLLGLAFLAGAGLLVVLGIWTFTFSETRGELVEMKDTGLMMSGRYDGVPFVHGRPSRTGSLAVEYRYLAEGQRIKGTRIGMGLAPWTLSPLGSMRWERYAQKGARLTVYHATGMPTVSVLHRGIDLVSTAILALVGFSLLRFSAWLERHRHPDCGLDQ